MDITVKRLDSGIGYVFRKISSPVAYCALSIKAGTRDESLVQNGIAHLTEHMLFKGTTKRGAKRINNFLEKLGGELNAYTTKEETVIHATVLKEDIGKAVELLADLAFNSLYPEKELVKEKDIVLDEIASYKDSPSEQIFDDFDEYLFGDHPLAMPILGKPKSVKRISVNDIKDFTAKHYTLSNMTFSIVADISDARGESMVMKHFGGGSIVSATEHVAEGNPVQLVVLPEWKEKRILRKTYQAHCVVGVPAFDLYDARRLPLALLTNILGGPALNSKLNLVLREKHAMAYTVDATYTPYTDTGLFTIYFGTDKSNIDKCLDILDKELFAIRSKELSPSFLKSAKKQLLGQLAIATDNAESQCLSMGKSLLFYGKVEPIELVREKIGKIDSVELLEIASGLLDRDKMFTLVYS
ncbi:MAG: M16 family metallopeptidase [Bacteroidales bacterium]|jgi:predicted Zn-dependent peptidase